ncbi:(Fe-S)-binding protein [Methyloversatilis thermotolerans]|uniref:(Fe-S)-binding protein n=1 Tax=Methyloversatilis thermotolerans TaxID=1346290 RepID=UPI00036FE594|nr:4Fe-4S dicluster domain-containing protein [Methyloversatilis thermotolerans]
MEPLLDWSAYDSYGLGDAYARIPASGGGFGKATAVCIGNRQCQRDEKGVMCPSFRVTRDTAHSTGHRANLLRQALDGELGDAPFAGPELAAALDLCVACKGCKRECPNGVDMASLRAESLARRWQARGGLPLRERLFARLPLLLPHLVRFRHVLALRGRLPPLARLVERLFGISARRSLPQPAARSFLQEAPECAGPPDGREVLLLADCFNNHFDPDIARAAVDVLASAGFRVRPLRAAGGPALCCGRTAFSSGDLALARSQARRLLDVLVPHVEAGGVVIGLEPSCLLMLRDEYRMLGLGVDVDALAKSVLLMEEFLAREHDAKRLDLAFADQGGRAAKVHGHCHQKAFGAMKAMRKVLNLVPGLNVELIESSCCGMAGSFGYEAEHYETSMRMAELALLPEIRAAAPDACIVANGTSCRHQIRDGARRDSLHLAQLLRDALVRQD